MIEEGQAPAIAVGPAAAGTDWSAIATTTLIPLTVAAGFFWFGLTPPTEVDDWARGLYALIPLEFFRALVYSILSETYREYRTPWQAVRVFLTSLAILVAGSVFASLLVMKGDWFAWITQPKVYSAIAFAIALIAVDGVINVFFFRGDPHRLAARLEATADDARDWVQLVGIQLTLVLALAYGALLIAKLAGHAAWVPDPPSEAMHSILLLYASFYFFGKAIVLAYAYTGEFNGTGARLFGAEWIQALIWEKNKDPELRARNERAAERRRRAILTGEADASA